MTGPLYHPPRVPGGPTAARSRRAASLIAALAVLLVVAVGVAQLASGERLPGSGKQYERTERPLNIVLLLSDDQPIGTFERMPYLSSRRWSRFPNAVISNPLCCPSRATILTGRYSDRTGVETNSDAPRFDDSETIATTLRERGYRTAFVGKYLNEYPWDRGERWRPPGWDRWVAMRGKLGYYDYGLNVDGELVERGSRDRDHVERVIRRHSLDWIGQKDERPFFLLVSSYAPHPPATAEPGDARAFHDLPVKLPPSVNERDVSDKPRWIRRLDRLEPRKLRAAHRDRARAALAVDRTARRIITALRRSGELERTLFVYLTDNGYSLGEHRRFGKNCGYEECVRTPLLIRRPGGGPERIPEPVGNADLAPTFADLAGAELSPWPDGESLVPLLEGRRPSGERAILLRNAESTRTSGRPELWGVRTRTAKYLRHTDGERELYDLRRDPWELHNRAGQRSHRALERRLAAELRQLRGRRP